MPGLQTAPVSAILDFVFFELFGRRLSERFRSWFVVCDGDPVWLGTVSELCLLMGKRSADLKMDACVCTGHVLSICFFLFLFLAPFVRAIANVVKVGSAFAATGA